MEQRELRALENQCIQECAPACTAACPLHVDVRAVLLEMARGDFAAALKALRKTLPFPGIIGRICTHPCQAVCKRGEAGDVLAIAALERACADFGGAAEKPRILPRRNARVAIVGGGLSGLTAAYDLARKGYPVVIFDADERLGGSLWDVPERDLPRDVLDAEVAQVVALGIEVRLNTRVGENDLAALRREFQAVYLATGGRAGETFGLETGEYPPAEIRAALTVPPADVAGVRRIPGTGHEAPVLCVDPVTYETRTPGVFAGGALLRGAAATSPIDAIADGRRAAISIDRLAQKVSLTASRAGEGAYATRLYTNTAGIAPLPAVPLTNPTAGYGREDAQQEAQRCLQCECMECVKACEYLRHYGRYPRRYVREIYNNLSIVKGERKANTFINSCSLCGQCGVICPTDLDMGAVNAAARRAMVAEKRMPPSAHDFALRDMQFSNSDRFALARHRPGAAASGYVFFPGCQLAGSSPEYVEAVYGYLQAKLGAVGLMLRCCGAPADWAGRTDLFGDALAEFRHQHAALGAPQVVLACSSCYRVFQTSLPDVRIVSLWELYDRLGLPDGLRARPGEGRPALSMHDPCSTRAETRLQDSARNLVRRLGYAIEELPLTRERTACCSYGGVQWLANRELARAGVRRRIAESEADYVTYCAMCRDFFAAQGKRTFHVLDLLYAPDAERRAERGSPGYSQRHENRARLKRKLLKDLWGEDMDDAPAYASIRIVLAEGVRERMEDRLILVEDVQRVIEFAERTGGKLLNRKTGHWLAYFKPSAVTYWVEYSPQDGAFVVHNAYSHRMEIGMEGQA